MKYIFCIFSLLITCQILSGQTRSNLTVIPAPASVSNETGNFIFSGLTEIRSDVAEKNTVRFLTDYLLNEWKYKSKLSEKKHKPVKGQNIVYITNSGADELPAEGYVLAIKPDSIILRAKGAGLFYGIQTLIQLFPNKKAGTAVLPCLTIKDHPQFSYRGFMLDVSRHFFTVKQVKDVLDMMASYKLNRFHWHLTDDQGWRIEIKSYPKLTEIGAWRVPRLGDFSGREAPKSGEVATEGGFYTQEEIKDVVKYAAKRHIEILPEIDVPGHSMAAIAAYPELSVTKNPDTKVNPGSSFAKWFPDGTFEMYADNTLNPTDEKVYTFLDKVFEEVATLFPYEYIHIGGDECYKGFWEKDVEVQRFMKKMDIHSTHELQTYFTARVNKILLSKHKKLIGWDEILDGGLNDNVAVMNRFGKKGALEQVKKGLNVIMAPGDDGFYFDYAQSKSDMEPVNHGGFSPLWKAYNYDPAYKELSNSEKKHILGVEGCLWTEGVPNISKLQYMTLPRMLALAETAWSDPAMKDYGLFASSSLPVHLERFDRSGVNYRVPTTFNYTDTTLVGNRFYFDLKPTVPGAKIYYTLSNRFPGDADHEYKEPLNISLNEGQKKILKTVVISPSGRRSVVTRTVMYNPALKKASVNSSTQQHYTVFKGPFKSFDQISWGTSVDSGTTANYAIATGYRGKEEYGVVIESMLKIEENGVYEFSSTNNFTRITIDGDVVFDSEKPYPKFDKPDPIFLQKGFHPVKISRYSIDKEELDYTLKKISYQK